METIKVVPVDTARSVFDIATNSLDFGSGFLDHEEVDALRAFAVLIGIDPSKVARMSALAYVERAA